MSDTRQKDVGDWAIEIAEEASEVPKLRAEIARLQSEVARLTKENEAMRPDAIQCVEYMRNVHWLTERQSLFKAVAKNAEALLDAMDRNDKERCVVNPYRGRLRDALAALAPPTTEPK